MQGKRVEEFEHLIKDYVGAEYAVAVSSCSTALHLAMRVSSVGVGDEVIVPSLTWVATAAAVEECGAKSVFADIDPRTFNVDPDHVELLITERTRAFIAVNLFGLAADLTRLRDLAAKKGLILIEDAACSLGATAGGQQSGTFGRLGCFSFHPRKSITTGEGGMIVGARREDADMLRSLRSHGYNTHTRTETVMQPYDMGDFDQLGYNYRMSDIHAAVGIAQMKKLNSFLDAKRRIARAYNEGLRDLELLTLPLEPDTYRHTYQSYVVTVGDATCGTLQSDFFCNIRNEIMLQLESAGIATRPGTHAVHSLSYYKSKYGLKEWDLPNAYRVMRQSIALPMYPSMTEKEVEYAIEQVKCACSTAASRYLTRIHAW